MTNATHDQFRHNRQHVFMGEGIGTPDRESATHRDTKKPRTHMDTVKRSPPYIVDGSLVPREVVEQFP